MRRREKPSRDVDKNRFKVSIQRSERIIRDLIEEIKRYIDLRIQLFKANLEKKVGEIANSAISVAIFAILGLISFIFINISAALGIGAWLGDAWGFLIVGVLWLVVGLTILKVQPDFAGVNNKNKKKKEQDS